MGAGDFIRSVMEAGKGAGNIFGAVKDGSKDAAKDFFSGKIKK